MADALPPGVPSGDVTRAASVLVVEDEAELREVYRRVLESAGLSVRLAPNGRQACRMLEQAPADLVLTDLLMPEMDGIELIAWMRRQGHRMPVLMVSGANAIYQTDYLAVCRDLGATDTLEKPVRPEPLLAAVRRLLAAPLSSAA